MGVEEMNRIKDAFTALNMHPVYSEHEPVVTSEDASRIRGVELKSGIKTLLFTNGKDDWIVVNIPADKKVDVKKVANNLGWSKNSIRMGTEEEVIEKTGCQIGAVPPFGHKDRIHLLIDVDVYDNKESNFNIGLRTNSVNIPTVEMKILFQKLKSVEGDFIKQ